MVHFIILGMIMSNNYNFKCVQSFRVKKIFDFQQSSSMVKNSTSVVIKKDVYASCLFKLSASDCQKRSSDES